MKKKKITIRNVDSTEEKDFDSQKEASEFLNISPMQLSRIINKKGSNYTGYYITTD